MKQKRNTKRVQKFLEQIEWAFELNNYQRTLVNKEHQPEDSPDLTAEVKTDEIYKTIELTLYPNFWDYSLTVQRDALLHELVHTILIKNKNISMDLLNGVHHSPQGVKDADEKSVTHITVLLSGLLQGRFRYIKQAYLDYIKK